MKLDIEPVNVRLRRLQTQIKCIEADYRKFTPRLNDYRLSINPNENATEHVERIHVDWVIPEEWAVILGEIMHNLRSALDNLIWQLVLAGDSEPGDNHEFPIAHDRDWYDKVAPRKLRNVPEAARRIIDQVQPCKGPANLIRVHPLWIVHNLSRIDKHRGLHVVAAYPGKGEFETTAEMRAVEGGKMRLWYRPLEDGTEVRSFITPTPFHGNVPVGKVVTLEVVVRETDETPFYEFPGVARTCAQTVSQTVSAVAAADATG